MMFKLKMKLTGEEVKALNRTLESVDVNSINHRAVRRLRAQLGVLALQEARDLQSLNALRKTLRKVPKEDRRDVILKFLGKVPE